jgi:hypothetical protein
LYRGRINATALLGSFEENIPRILQIIGTTFAFFFIDPTGWGLAMDNIVPLLRHRPGEVMVNFMYDFVNRFVNFPDPANERSLDRFFGTHRWRDIRSAGDREAASLECYQQQLRASGSYEYVTSTRILKPHSDRAYFHLVYATRSSKGILKFRDVEKQTIAEQDVIRTTAQREHRETKTGQQELIFAPPGNLSGFIQEERVRRLEEARGRLLAILKDGPAGFEQLQARILEIPLVWASDLNNMLMDGHREGWLFIEGLSARQRVPNSKNRIALQNQP